ncbi:MAG: hypothetical protein RIQ60_4278 [Pseudomonadota bacterium]|jgi:hypothetical protein
MPFKKLAVAAALIGSTAMASAFAPPTQHLTLTYSGPDIVTGFTGIGFVDSSTFLQGYLTTFTSVLFDSTPVTILGGGTSFQIQSSSTSLTHTVDIYADVMSMPGVVNPAPKFSTSFTFLTTPTQVQTPSTQFTPPSAPVPEPESYAMLLAGLGALGFMGKRRAAKQA